MRASMMLVKAAGRNPHHARVENFAGEGNFLDCRVSVRPLALAGVQGGAHIVRRAARPGKLVRRRVARLNPVDEFAYTAVPDGVEQAFKKLLP